jgi:hypothetical protein
MLVADALGNIFRHDSADPGVNLAWRKHDDGTGLELCIADAVEFVLCALVISLGG